MYIDCADEYESNWMSFIRPASCYSEQNLIAFQLGGTEIYFATIKNIPPRTELRIWYAKAYAETIGENILEITAEEAAGNKRIRIILSSGNGVRVSPEGKGKEKVGITLQLSRLYQEGSKGLVWKAYAETFRESILDITAEEAAGK